MSYGIIDDEFQEAVVMHGIAKEDAVRTGGVTGVVEDPAAWIDLDHENFPFRVHTEVATGIAIAFHFHKHPRDIIT